MFGVLGIPRPPPFVTGIVLLYVFSAALGLVPAFGTGTGFVDRLWHLALPSLALVLSVMAIVVKITRHGGDRGAGEGLCGVLHVPASLEPGSHRVLLRTSQRADLRRHCRWHSVLSLLANAVYVEVTFALPGLGSLLVDAVEKRDLPVIQGTTLVFTCFVVILNLIIDGVYALIDPRIRFTKVPA